MAVCSCWIAAILTDVYCSCAQSYAHYTHISSSFMWTRTCWFRLRFFGCFSKWDEMQFVWIKVSFHLSLGHCEFGCQYGGVIERLKNLSSGMLAYAHSPFSRKPGPQQATVKNYVRLSPFWVGADNYSSPRSMLNSHIHSKTQPQQHLSCYG